MGDDVAHDRVFDDQTGKVDVLVAARLGVVDVELSGDRVGRFGVEHRCLARDVAVDGGTVAVASDEDLMLAGDLADAMVPVDETVSDGARTYASTGFGPAVAVDVVDDRVFVASDDGRVLRYEPAAGDWHDLGSVESPRAIDAPLVGADDGVYRLADGLDYTGLSAVRDVDAHTVPLAATDDGLYALGNGWMKRRDGAFSVVSTDGVRAYAADEDGVYRRHDDDWHPVSLPVDEPVADVAFTPDAVLVLTEAGTLLADAGDGWRTRSLGVVDAAALAVLD